ncbi:FkbM family methyltransferase [Candidatus Poribacteria bacterium]|nr:FkbM family methyltransferase [Candidatus Poribacteria bacterium]
MNKKCGVFYEIGAAGYALRHLLEDDWHAENQKRLEKGENLYADPVYFPDIEKWNGYFIDPSPCVIKDGLQFGIPGHHFNMAIAGTHRVERIETFLPENSEDLGLCSLANNVLFIDTDVHKTFYTYCITLDALFDFTQAPPDLLRVDVEGAEHEVFEAYSFKHRPRVIQIDYHTVLGNLISILENHDYKIVDTAFDNEDLLAIDERILL